MFGQDDTWTCTNGRIASEASVVVVVSSNSQPSGTQLVLALPPSLCLPTARLTLPSSPSTFSSWLYSQHSLPYYPRSSPVVYHRLDIPPPARASTPHSSPVQRQNIYYFPPSVFICPHTYWPPSHRQEPGTYARMQGLRVSEMRQSNHMELG